MAGYSGTPLWKKLGITEGVSVSVVDAPDSFDLSRENLPPDVEIAQDFQPADIHVVFARTATEMESRFRRAMTAMPADGSIWVAWPKRSSGIESDITDSRLREMLLPTGLVDNKVCAIDDIWSGLRFVVRTENRPEWRFGA
jgi:hypothetical protein